MTLDGCVDHPEGIADDETHAFTRLMNEGGAMLWGRTTYEMMESYWPAVARGEVEAPPAMRRTCRAGGSAVRRNTVGRRHGTCGGEGHDRNDARFRDLNHHIHTSSSPAHRLPARARAREAHRRHADLSDTHLREQTNKSAASAALNTAEAAAWRSRADKSRVFTIAIAEACEACAAVEIAGAKGACAESDVRAVVALGCRVKDVLSRLVR